MTNTKNNKPIYGRPGWLGWSIFICGLIITIGLGSWQVQRLAWKEGLIEKIELAKTQAPQTVIPTETDALNALDFYHVTLSGTWIENAEFHIAARYFEGTLGYHVLQALKLNDGRIAIVNRGWVPSEQKEIADRIGWETASGVANITALVRIGADRNDFTPESQPDQNVYFGRDVMQMAEAAGLDTTQVIPASFDVIGDQTARQLPIPSTGDIKLRNDHLSYVLTWYLIAMFMVIIFLRYLRLSKAASDPQ